MQSIADLKIWIIRMSPKLQPWDYSC